MYGLSHSEILGSRVICTYPKLIAAYHVLHRLCEPRHPPYALSYFSYDINLIQRVRTRQIDSLILSAVIVEITLVLSYLQFFACVNMSKIIFPVKGEWRITDSNR